MMYLLSALPHPVQDYSMHDRTGCAKIYFNIIVQYIYISEFMCFMSGKPIFHKYVKYITFVYDKTATRWQSKAFAGMNSAENSAPSVFVCCIKTNLG